MNAHAHMPTDHVRTSRYLTMRDGTRLAIDILRPAIAGLVSDDPRPVIWVATKYQRARVTHDGRIEPIFARIPVLRTLLDAGYIIAVLDVRGSGASFGVLNGTDAPTDRVFRDDLHQVATWLGEQPWCNGAIGMYGVSYVAGTQIAAAMMRPPYLRCIVPQQVTADSGRGLMNINGIQNIRFRERRDTIMQRLNIERPAARVDEDVDGLLLAAAVEQHRAQRGSLKDLVPAARPLDLARIGESRGEPIAPWPPISASGIAIFHWGSWRDLFPDETLKLYEMLRATNPSRLIMGPWPHEAQEQSETPGIDIAAILRRWYDYWLKGEDQGYSQEPNVRYVVLRAPADQAWRSAASWPPAEALSAQLMLNEGGRLLPEPGNGHTDYTVDFAMTTAPLATRYSLDRGNLDFGEFDARGACFTTPAFSADAELVGHPVLDLWVSSDTEDFDIFAYLQIVEADGASRTVTEGMMRASCRDKIEAPFDPRQPKRLRFELLPTAVRIHAGECLRITITGADSGVWNTPQQIPPPRLRIHHDHAAPSRLVAPFLHGAPPERGAFCTGLAANSIVIGASEHG